MKKTRIILTSILLATLFACLSAAVACSRAVSLNEWSAPSYSDVTVGDSVPVLPVSASDTKGNTFNAAVEVFFPISGSRIVSPGTSFAATEEGVYTIIYTVDFGGVKIQKPVQFRANAAQSGNNSQGGSSSGSSGGGSSGGGSGSGSGSGSSGGTTVTNDPVLGGLKILANSGAEEYFSVSGNTVTVLKSHPNVDDWKVVGWDLTGWTAANGANIEITIVNNTSEKLEVKYKAECDNKPAFANLAIEDEAIAAGGKKVWTSNVGAYDIAEPVNVKQIALNFGTSATRGTITVSARLSGNGSSGGGTGSGSSGGGSSGGTTVTNDPVLGGLKILANSGSEDYFSVSGKTVTVKQSSAIDNYKSVGWELTGWTAAKGAYIDLSIGNGTGAGLEIIYKVVGIIGGEEVVSYYDVATLAAETAIAKDNTKRIKLAVGVERAYSSVSKIELFIGTSVSSGSITIDASLTNDGSGSVTEVKDEDDLSFVLGYLGVVNGSGDFFSVVSGNKVKVKRSVTMGEYKSVYWALNGWTHEKAPYINISITNETTAPIEIMYKVVGSIGGSEKISYYDIARKTDDDDTSIKAGETIKWSSAVDLENGYDDVSKIEIFIATSVSSGTVVIDANLSATAIEQSGASEISISAPRLTYDDEEHNACFSINGDEIQVLKAIGENDYKSVSFDIEGWNAENHNGFYYTVESDIAEGVTVKCKIHTDGTAGEGDERGIGYAYPDVILIGAGTLEIDPISAINDQPDATDVSQLEFFIITGGTGKVIITPAYCKIEE